jgi:hypothetical protein
MTSFNFLFIFVVVMELVSIPVFFLSKEESFMPAKKY